MVLAAEAAGRVLMVGHNMRFGRAARLARRLLDQGRLGEVVSVEIHFSSDGARHLAPGAWRLRPDQCALLPVMQLGIHAVDLVHYLLGPVAEVAGYARSVVAPAPAVDNVAAAFRLAGGETGTLVSNYCTQVTFEYRIAGTAGTLRCTPHRLSYRSTAATDGRGEGPAEEHDFTAYDRESYRRQMEAFGRAVRDRATPEADGWTGLQALAVVEALDEAVRTHAPVSVPAFTARGAH
jgi:predicted dehydrogenase